MAENAIIYNLANKIIFVGRYTLQVVTHFKQTPNYWLELNTILELIRALVSVRPFQLPSDCMLPFF